MLSFDVHIMGYYFKNIKLVYKLDSYRAYINFFHMFNSKLVLGYEFPMQSNFGSATSKKGNMHIYNLGLVSRPFVSII
jgi:hypothetical protein